MQQLNTTDRMHVHAADCWISVGNLDQARNELAAVASGIGDHPDVLQVRWHLCAQARQWDACEEIARNLTQLAPDRVTGWLQLAQSLRRLNRFKAAAESVRSGLESCGEKPALVLSLACCEARSGRMKRAVECLRQALALAGDWQARNRLLFRAFEETDLDSVWSATDVQAGVE